MIFDDIINKELQEENKELEAKLEKAFSKIDNFELEISKRPLKKKFKKYSKLYNEISLLHYKMSKIKKELNKGFKSIDESVSMIMSVKQVQTYMDQGDSILKTNSKLSKQSYNKALRLSEKLFGVNLMGEDEIRYIKERITVADNMYTIEYAKDTMSSINKFLTKSRDLDKVVEKLGKVDFSTMNDFDFTQVNELVSKVLETRPTQLGKLVKSLKSNPTNNNKIELKLV